MKPTFPGLVTATAEAAGVSEAITKRVLVVFFGVLSEAVWEAGRAVVPGLGLFAVRRRRAHRIVHPKTNEAMVVDSQRAVYARVAKSWRRRE